MTTDTQLIVILKLGGSIEIFYNLIWQIKINELGDLIIGDYLHILPKKKPSYLCFYNIFNSSGRFLRINEFFILKCIYFFGVYIPFKASNSASWLIAT